MCPPWQVEALQAEVESVGQLLTISRSEVLALQDANGSAAQQFAPLSTAGPRPLATAPPAMPAAAPEKVTTAVEYSYALSNTNSLSGAASWCGTAQQTGAVAASRPGTSGDLMDIALSAPKGGASSRVEMMRAALSKGKPRK